MPHTIELKKVSKYYASADNVSMGFSRVDLSLDMGEFVAITGESGSGKSTLLNVISGLDSYEEGEMFIFGEDTTAYNTEDYEHYRKTYIGNIFQDFNLVNSYTVYQNIELVMLLCGKKKKECKQRINELIELVGLKEYTRRKASKLSGGQKQRVAIARALAKDAPIIVADEPTGNLDSESAANVMKTLAEVSKDKLVVIVTHNYEQAEPYVTRKLTMHDGKIIEDKTLDPEARTSIQETPAEEPVEEPVEELKEELLEEPAEELDESMNLVERDIELEEITWDKLEQGAESAPEEEADEPAKAEEASEAAEASDEPTNIVNPPEFKAMRKGASLRLGVRNTFNIVSKFVLLFIVYLFVATAFLGQYASVKGNQHESDMLGYSSFFSNTDLDRIIVTNKDGSAIDDEDIQKIENTVNVDKVFKNDIALDKSALLELKDAYITGPLFPISEVKEKDITYGRMPENDKEIVLEVDSNSDVYSIVEDMKEKLIGKSTYIRDNEGSSEKMTSSKVTIAGIIVKNESEALSPSMYFGYSIIYVSDAVSEETLSSYMASTSNSIINYGGTKVENSSYRVVFASPRVSEGNVYITSYQSYYYDQGKCVGKPLSITIKNRYFTTKGDYTVTKEITEKNIEAELGMDKDYFDSYSSAVFINPKDYDKLFKTGNFQVSAFTENELDYKDTIEALNKKGFKTLAVKDTFSDITGGFGFVIKLLDYAKLIIEFIVLLMIAYAVIKIIMKSRNSYYSTVRILGGTKKNTDTILRVELLLMMCIAYAVDIAFVLLCRHGIIKIAEVNKLLNFLELYDYVILGGLLLVMSLLIARRYSKKLFTKSAMNAYRGEV